MHKPLSLTCLDVDAQPGEPDAPIQFERPTSPAPLDSLAPNLRRSKRLGSTRSMTSAMSESFVFGVVPFKDAVSTVTVTLKYLCLLLIFIN